MIFNNIVSLYTLINCKIVKFVCVILKIKENCKIVYVKYISEFYNFCKKKDSNQY